MRRLVTGLLSVSVATNILFVSAHAETAKAKSKSPANYSSFHIQKDNYYRFDTILNKVAAGSPKSLKTVTGVWSDANAALYWDPNSAYLFNGGEYLKLNFTSSKAEAGYPKSIEANWPGVWKSGVDAAVNVDGRKLYFFKGDEYIRFDTRKNKVVSGPSKIKDGWPGVWPTGVDAAMNADGKNVYFFKGDEYLRFSLGSNKVRTGYPKKISAGWNGLPASGLSAAFKRN